MAEMCRRFRANLLPPLRRVKTEERTSETCTDLLRTIASDDAPLAELPCQAYSQNKTTSGEFPRNATLFSIQSCLGNYEPVTLQKRTQTCPDLHNFKLGDFRRPVFKKVKNWTLWKSTSNISLVGTKAQCGGIMLGDKTGGGAVMPRPIRFHCAGLPISPGVDNMYTQFHVAQALRNINYCVSRRVRVQYWHNQEIRNGFFKVFTPPTPRFSTT